MEITPFRGQWRRKAGYNRISPTNRRNVKTARFGTGNSSGGGGGGGKRPWRLRIGRKLRLMRLAAASPMKLWYRFKNAYMKMMLSLSETAGTSNSGNVFGTKRIPKAREAAPMAYSRSEFENRLVLEIYKSMVASLELGYNKK
ncbi:hypothetical protein ABFX02_12G028500 [Erythranthe guttata]